jgi:PPM family protein phosphatase
MKPTTVVWRAGAASDTGPKREKNEDRILVDEAGGIFLVVDGLGGHAAGEKAAEIAVETIAGDLKPDQGDLEQQVRRAITLANNEIYRAAGNNPEWSGMACVLTLAVAHEETVTVGHVGDSRLYLLWNGSVRKLTSDHSPVGEREDRGELTEGEAMSHPRRNEVFRDVGSCERTADTNDFVEVKSFPFHPAAALLLCSDGLSDVVTSAEIGEIVEEYDGEPTPIAEALVEAANANGGTDNVSVIFVAGEQFAGIRSPSAREARARHAITRARSSWTIWKVRLRPLLWLMLGVILGMAMWGLGEKFL